MEMEVIDRIISRIHFNKSHRNDLGVVQTIFRRSNAEALLMRKEDCLLCINGNYFGMKKY